MSTYCGERRLSLGRSESGWNNRRETERLVFLLFNEAKKHEKHSDLMLALNICLAELTVFSVSPSPSHIDATIFEISPNVASVFCCLMIDCVSLDGRVITWLLNYRKIPEKQGIGGHGSAWLIWIPFFLLFWRFSGKFRTWSLHICWKWHGSLVIERLVLIIRT